MRLSCPYQRTRRGLQGLRADEQTSIANVYMDVINLLLFSTNCGKLNGWQFVIKLCSTIVGSGFNDGL